MHAERTSDERVVRWVTHLPWLAESCAGRRQPAPGSAVGALLAGGVIEAVVVSGSDVLVQAPAASWAAIIADVDAAVRADLDGQATWWYLPACATSCTTACAASKGNHQPPG